MNILRGRSASCRGERRAFARATCAAAAASGDIVSANLSILAAVAIASITAALLGLCPSPASAQWTSDLSANAAVCTEAGDQTSPLAVSDGSGGLIAVWADQRLSPDTDLYAQRLAPDGRPLWALGGVALCSSPNSQHPMAIVADGQGGAIVAWIDHRNAAACGEDIFAQRVSAEGKPLWGADGLAVCSAPGTQAEPALAPDGSGGAVFAWTDLRLGSAQPDVYVQRVGASGQALWTENGAPVTTSPGARRNPALAPDGQGGAVVAWSGTPSTECDESPTSSESSTSSEGAGTIAPGFPAERVRAQRFSPEGAALWAAEGIELATRPGRQIMPLLCPDASGSIIAAWHNSRPAGEDYAACAQRLALDGARLWDPAGVDVCPSPGAQSGTQIVPAAEGGVILAWNDLRTTCSEAIYAQRLDAQGAPRWTPQGVSISPPGGSHRNVRLLSDQGGGAIAAWEDWSTTSACRLRASRLDPSGQPLWQAGGAPVSLAGGSQFAPAAVPLDGITGTPTSFPVIPVQMHNELKDGLYVRRRVSTLHTDQHLSRHRLRPASAAA